MKEVLILVIFLFSLSSCSLISNVLPRLDTKGSIVNAHDGCLVQFNNTFFIYGTVYENCTQTAPTCSQACGYYGNTFALYTSPDMVTWTLITTNVLPELTKDNAQVSYWSPNVAYNKLTKQYFMSYWSGHYGFQNSNVAIATSSTPFGPFVNQPPITMHGCTVTSSTQGLIVDEFGTALIRYNTRDAPLRHVIELLTPDWMNTTGIFTNIVVKNDYPWYEGGGMFIREGVFYAMLGTDCCYCQWGGDALVFSATDPLGNWTQVIEANYCEDGSMPTLTGLQQVTNPCDVQNPGGLNFTIPAQQFNVATLQTKSGPFFMYYGERFRSSPDGIKAHDFQAWIPLNFSGNAIQKMQWVDQFEIDV